MLNYFEQAFTARAIRRFDYQSSAAVNVVRSVCFVMLSGWAWTAVTGQDASSSQRTTQQQIRPVQTIDEDELLLSDELGGGETDDGDNDKAKNESDEESEEETEDGFEDESKDESENEIELNPGENEADAGSYAGTKPLRLNLLHESSYITSSPSGLETNRLSLRANWEKLFSSTYFAKIDAKTILHLDGDRRTEISGDSYKFRMPVRELYVQGSWGDTSLAIGRQLVIWGESDVAAITDVISPRNIQDLLFTSVDESRLGQDVIKLDQYTDLGQLSFLVVPDPRVDKQPLLDRNFNIDGVDLSGLEIVSVGNDRRSAEYGFRWKRSFKQGDYSVMLARLSDNEAVLRFRERRGEITQVSEEFRNYAMLGSAANFAVSGVGINLEAALNYGRSFQTREPYSESNIGFLERNSIQTAIGAEYTTQNNHTFFAGLANDHLFGDVTGLNRDDRNLYSLTMGWSKTYLHETLSLSYTFQYEINDKNAIHSLSASYALNDRLSIGLDLFKLTTGDEERFSYYDQQSIGLQFEYHYH